MAESAKVDEARMILLEKLAGLSEKMDSALGKIAYNGSEITTVVLQSSVNHSELTKINGKLAKMEEDIRTIRQLIAMSVKKA